MREAAEAVGLDTPISFTITGSGGMGLADVLNLKFIQEVIACTKTVEVICPQTDVAIELGGEDAKITFFGASLEQKMNGSCAGGTGAFIDQMASLLKTDANGLNELAKGYTHIYPIASRCGVFAKTDIQPLINDGARQEDLAASIFQAVVNQTIAGLASGHKIQGNVAFLGGPLYFMSELRQRFIETLHLKEENVVFPENPQLFVAKGAAFYAGEEEPTTIAKLLDSLAHIGSALQPTKSLDPLFNNEEELKEFRDRHAKAKVDFRPLETYCGKAYLGIDAGSTTTKIVLMSEDKKILYTWYGNNDGDPLQKTIDILTEMYKHLPENVTIAKACTTGYGEHLIKSALKADLGEVETVAHYKAAHYFQPNVDFILDIGGQDMKAMHVKNGALSTIQLTKPAHPDAVPSLKRSRSRFNTTSRTLPKQPCSLKIRPISALAAPSSCNRASSRLKKRVHLSVTFLPDFQCPSSKTPCSKSSRLTQLKTSVSTSFAKAERSTTKPFCAHLKSLAVKTSSDQTLPA